MKKLISICLAVFCILASSVLLLSCGNATSDTSTEKTTYTVGICNYVNDASLNQIIENIINELATISAKNNVVIKVVEENCNTDAAVLSQIIANFMADKVDLMVGVATPVAMAMQAATEDTDIPVIFAAVSDPVGAGIVESLETPGHNITGTSDYLNTTAIMNIMLAMNPDINKVGLLYDVGQDASTKPIADAKAFFEAKGIEVIEKTGTNVTEITLAAQALVTDGVEAVFTPTDNSIMNAELAIYEIFENAGIPHYTGADSFALNGAFLGYGVDYANLGRETAKMIAGVLLDGKSPAAYAVQTFDNGTATINTDICASFGLDIETLKTTFAPYCTKVQTIRTAESFE